MKFFHFLAAGVVASLVLHGAGSAFFARDPDEVSIAASEGGGVAVIGSIEDLVAGARADAVSETAPADEVEPATVPFQPVREPVRLAAVAPDTPVKPVEVAPVQSVTDPVSTSTVPVVKGVARSEPVTVIEPSEALSRQAFPSDKTIAPVKPLELTRSAEPQAVRNSVEIARVDPAMTAEPVTQVLEVQQPLETPLAAVERSPRTKPKPPGRLTASKKTPDKKIRAAQKTGANTSSRKGGEQITSQSARSNANGRKDARSRDGGTRAVSNYKGKVVARLRRAKRYPPQARRRALAGTAHVAFTISRNGSVSGIRLSRSSGHALLDQAALDMVRRAAPMPEFPGDVTAPRMRLQVPVRFDR